MDRERPPGARRTILLLAPALALCAVPLGYRFFHPFVTTADNNTAIYAQPARNLVRHGLVATRMGLAFNLGGEEGPFYFYAHHPPLAALGASAAFLIAGARDWAARIYPAACSLASAAILFFLWRRARGERAALLAVAFMATLPAYGHVGKMLGSESPTLTFGLLAILLYQAWKEAPPDRAPRTLAGSLAAYAAGCFSGWAAFYVGPILIADALLTLRRERGRLGRCLLGFGLTGAACFALIIGHFVLLTGSLKDITGAAASRAIESASGVRASLGHGPWIGAQVSHFRRFYGTEAAVLALAGLLAGAVALARRRAHVPVWGTAAILAAFGVAHPLVFRWASYNHDWLQFHLLPIVAVAAAEGTLAVASAVSWLLRSARAPRPAARAVAVLIVVGALGHRAALCARDLEARATEIPRYSWPLLGAEVDRLAPRTARLMGSLRRLDAPLRFYLDRPFDLALKASDFDRLTALGVHALYVREANLPLEPDLEARLRRYPWVDVGDYRLHRLTAAAEGTPAAEDDPVEPLLPTGSGGPLYANFGDTVELIGYDVSRPSSRPRPPSLVEAYLGLTGGSLSLDRVVSVTTFWRALKADLPAWKVWVTLGRKEADGPWQSLPPLGVVEIRPVLSWWKGRDRFRVTASFLILDGASPGPYDVHVAVYGDGQQPVRPLLPGPAPKWQGDVKMVVVGDVALYP